MFEDRHLLASGYDDYNNKWRHRLFKSLNYPCIGENKKSKKDTIVRYSKIFISSNS